MHYTGCDNNIRETGFSCNLADKPEYRCEACNQHVLRLQREQNWSPLVAPKSPEQIRREYFANLKESLKNGD